MRKFLLAVAVLALFGVSARAQEPRVEVFTGFSYGQFNPGGLLTESASGVGRHFSMPGLEASGEFNLGSHLGVVADVTGYGGTSDVDLTAKHLRFYNYLFGPQLTQRGIGPFDVFVRALAGTSHARTSFNSGGVTCPNGQTTATCSQTLNRFSYGAGGGIDLNASPHIGLRIIQIDYLRNDFTNCTAGTTCAGRSGRQDNYRIAAGFNWRF